MSKRTILKGNYIKVTATGRFKSRSTFRKRKATSNAIVNNSIYPFSTTVLTDFAF